MTQTKDKAANTILKGIQTNDAKTVTIGTIRAKAFSGQSVQTHRVRIEDGIVRVWDGVAGHFTTCHSLSKSTQARILADAR